MASLKDFENKKNPTNRDIVELITQQHEEVAHRLGAVEEQVKYTNGRVRALETRAIESDAVEKYKAQHEPSVSVTTTTVNSVDWQNILLKVIGVIMLVLTIVAAAVGAAK